MFSFDSAEHQVQEDLTPKNMQTTTYILQFLKKVVFSFERGALGVHLDVTTLERKHLFF